jgi:tRNA-dihydrouridine synthase B
VLSIGPYTLCSPVVLAPMAGVTDRPFRELCRRYGAGLAVSEMLISDATQWQSRKSQWRMDHTGEPGPISVQIAGSDPAQMADAARRNVELGAQIIDINMGCPAKKVCKRAAGSALLRDEKLVAEILSAVVQAVTVPVTLKIRTGWSLEERNGVRIAQIAEDCGIQLLAVHGRTKACRFEGAVEYDTIAAIKTCVRIPVLANGDIGSPQQAKAVRDYTGADGVMIGRSAQGRPWLCGQIARYLDDGVLLPDPSRDEQKRTMLGHLLALHQLYGDTMGPRIARKHIGWYLAENCEGSAFMQHFNRIEIATQQYDALHDFFETDTWLALSNATISSSMTTSFIKAEENRPDHYLQRDATTTEPEEDLAA